MCLYPDIRARQRIAYVVCEIWGILRVRRDGLLFCILMFSATHKELA